MLFVSIVVSMEINRRHYFRNGLRTMAGVSSTENEVYSVQQKVKQQQQLTVMGNGHVEVN